VEQGLGVREKRRGKVQVQTPSGTVRKESLSQLEKEKDLNHGPVCGFKRILMRVSHKERTSQERRVGVPETKGQTKEDVSLLS